MADFYVSVFEGNIKEVEEYISDNYKGCQWDCPTGREDVDGIISVLESTDVDVAIEIDGCGNIRCVGDLESFASIVEDNEEE